MPRTTAGPQVRACSQHSFEAHVRRDGLDAGRAREAPLELAPIGKASRVRDRRVRAQLEQSRPRLRLEAVQHRQNDDQCRDAEHKAEQRSAAS